MTFTYVDGAVAVILFLSGWLAYTRGFTRELIAIGGWLVAALLAFFFAPALKPLVEELPVVGPFFARECAISMIASFSLIVAFGLLILAVFTPIFASMVLESAIGPIDRIFGFLFGVVRGILLVAIAYLIYINVAGEQVLPQVENAAIKPLLDESAALIDRHRPTEMPRWFSNQIDALMAPCTGDAVPPPVTGTEGTEGATGTTTEGTGTQGN